MIVVLSLTEQWPDLAVEPENDWHPNDEKVEVPDDLVNAVFEARTAEANAVIALCRWVEMESDADYRVKSKVRRILMEHGIGQGG